MRLSDDAYVRKAAERMPDVGKKFEYLLNTGNMVSKSGLDLSQSTGYTVVAERLNWFRYLSHFRSVHRGAYFAEIRTTAVRKLMPESWGFMCPVHTPDGSPCGLLNHMAAMARVVHAGPDKPAATDAALCQLLAELGMMPAAPFTTPPHVPSYLSVQLDGRVVGYVQSGLAPSLVARLRDVKVATLAVGEGSAEEAAAGAQLADMSGPAGLVPAHMEVAFVPYAPGGTYPGVFLFTQSARLIRPVTNLRTGMVELLGSLEQHNMAIRCPDGGAGGSPGLVFTHAELHAMAMLSIVASMTPYSDYNQSPRNMYQCQMAKQTMGTPVQALGHRTDTKLYRIQVKRPASERASDRVLWAATGV